MSNYTEEERRPKKQLILNILDILRRYSDADHRLSQKDIVDILRAEYDMRVERKAIRRNIIALIEIGYEIEYSEAVRMVPDRDSGKLEKSYIWSDFYLVREFTDPELRLLIDSLLFSKHIPYSQCKELVEKLEGLSNRYFRSRVAHISTMPDTMPQNRQLFFTIETLDEAITKKRKVAFRYNSYGLDKKLHPRETDGRPVEYVVTPYQMAATNGRYYLIANTDGHDNVSHYRLDRITDIRLLDFRARPAKDIPEIAGGVDLPRHMAEHIYMFSGKSEPVAFRMKKYLVNDVIDWFGRDVRFTDETDDEVTAEVKVNLEAMRRWAMQYALHMTVLSPQSLADQVKSDVLEAAAKYE